jgi:hypothetical protein
LEVKTLAYHIISQDGNQVLEQTFETPEQAQSFLNSIEFEGSVIETVQLQQYLQMRQEYQQQDSYGPDQSEEEYLAENRRHNQYCRDRKLLYIPKREDPIYQFKPFNSRPARHSFSHPVISQPNFRPNMIPVNLIRSRPIRRQYYE